MRRGVVLTAFLRRVQVGRAKLSGMYVVERTLMYKGVLDIKKYN